MTETHPLAENERAEQEDRDLVARAQDGARTALDELVRRHQAWIYNIAVRMSVPSRNSVDTARWFTLGTIGRMALFSSHPIGKEKGYAYAEGFDHIIVPG